MPNTLTIPRYDGDLSDQDWRRIIRLIETYGAGEVRYAVEMHQRQERIYRRMGERAVETLLPKRR